MTGCSSRHQSSMVMGTIFLSRHHLMVIANQGRRAIHMPIRWKLYPTRHQSGISRSLQSNFKRKNNNYKKNITIKRFLLLRKTHNYKKKWLYSLGGGFFSEYIIVHKGVITKKIFWL